MLGNLIAIAIGVGSWVFATWLISRSVGPLDGDNQFPNNLKPPTD